MSKSSFFPLTITLCFADISAVALPPAAPVISDVTSTSCRLNYVAPDIQLDGPPVTGYFIEVRTPHGPWITVNKTAITGTEVRVTQLQCDMRYEFRLRAMNDNGLGEDSATSAGVVTLTENRPSQPGRPVATVRGTSVNLQWSMWMSLQKLILTKVWLSQRDRATAAWGSFGQMAK